MAEELGRSLYAIRHQLLPDMADIDRALDLAEAACASIQEVAPDVPGVAEGGTMKELCKAIKAKGIRLWVVAFNTTLTTDMTECAMTDDG